MIDFPTRPELMGLTNEANRKKFVEEWLPKVAENVRACAKAGIHAYIIKINEAPNYNHRNDDLWCYLISLGFCPVLERDENHGWKKLIIEW